VSIHTAIPLPVFIGVFSSYVSCIVLEKHIATNIVVQYILELR